MLPYNVRFFKIDLIGWGQSIFKIEVGGPASETKIVF
jgi:hypothetical protein